VTKDALASKHGEYDIVLANPPNALFEGGARETVRRELLKQAEFALR